MHTLESPCSAGSPPARRPSDASPSPIRDLLRRARERGAAGVEFIGLTVVASIVIAGLVAVPWMPTATDGLQRIVCGVIADSPFSNVDGCEGIYDPPPTEEELQPECLVSDTRMTRGSEVKVVFVTLGSNMVMQVREYSDGTTRVTLLDEYSLGARGDLGRLGLGKMLELKGGAGVKGTYGNGDTWVFDSPEAAQSFVDQAEDYANSNWNHVPIIGPIVNQKPQDPRISYHQVRIDGGVDANVAFKDLWAGKKNPETNKSDNKIGGPKDKEILDVGADLKFGRDVIIQHDRGEDLESSADDTETFVTTYEAGASGRGNVFGAGGGGNANSKGELRVTVDDSGQIINVTIRNTRNADAGLGSEYDDKNNSILTTSLDVETDAQRAVVEQWLMNPTNLHPEMYLFGPPMPDENGNADPFQQLLYEQAVMSEDVMEGDFTNNDWGAGATILGVGLSYDRKDQDQTSTNRESYYWGTPDADGVRHRTVNPKC
ncbi:hypothetical protein [Brevibacterium pityocampae]